MSRAFIFIASIFLIIAPSVFAEIKSIYKSDKFEVSAEMGILGHIRVFKTMPVTIMIAGKTDSGANSFLVELRITRKGLPDEIQQRPITILGKEEKSVQFPVYLMEDAREQLVQVIIRDPKTEEQLLSDLLVFADVRDPLDAHKLKPASTLGLIAVISPHISGYLPGMTMENPLPALVMPPASITETASMMSALDMIVWPDADPDSLDSDVRRKALTNWISLGGHLVVPLGGKISGLQTNFFSSLGIDNSIFRNLDPNARAVIPAEKFSDYLFHAFEIDTKAWNTFGAVMAYEFVDQKIAPDLFSAMRERFELSAEAASQSSSSDMGMEPLRNQNPGRSREDAASADQFPRSPADWRRIDYLKILKDLEAEGRGGQQLDWNKVMADVDHSLYFMPASGDFHVDGFKLTYDVPVGLGMVTFVAFSPFETENPFSSEWSAFWQALFEVKNGYRHASKKVPSGVSYDDWGMDWEDGRDTGSLNNVNAPSISGSLERFKAEGPPLVTFSIWFVLYLLAVGPIDYIVRRLFKLKKIAFFLFPVWVIGFSAFVLISYSGLATSPPELARLNFVDSLADSSYIRETSFISAFGERSEEIEIKLPEGTQSVTTCDDWPWFTSSYGQYERMVRAEVRWGETRITDESVSVPSLAATTLTYEIRSHEIRTPPIEVKLIEDERGQPVVNVKNNTEYDFPELFFVHRNGYNRSFDGVEALGTKEITLAEIRTGQTQNWNDYTPPRYVESSMMSASQGRGLLSFCIGYTRPELFGLMNSNFFGTYRDYGYGRQFSASKLEVVRASDLLLDRTRVRMFSPHRDLVLIAIQPRHRESLETLDSGPLNVDTINVYRVLINF
ncbi:MAG: hypothetical protein NUW37_18425 [Planctomycetes bacterium]|nr:hypothetical protein [Planctomycetota bacterium]